MAQRGTIIVCEYGHRLTLEKGGEFKPCPEEIVDQHGARSICGSQVWRTIDLWPFPLTWNDRRFLRLLRISRDE